MMTSPLRPLPSVSAAETYVLPMAAASTTATDGKTTAVTAAQAQAQSQAQIEGETARHELSLSVPLDTEAALNALPSATVHFAPSARSAASTVTSAKSPETSARTHSHSLDPNDAAAAGLVGLGLVPVSVGTTETTTSPAAPLSASSSLDALDRAAMAAPLTVTAAWVDPTAATATAATQPTSAHSESHSHSHSQSDADKPSAQDAVVEGSTPLPTTEAQIQMAAEARTETQPQQPAAAKEEGKRKKGGFRLPAMSIGSQQSVSAVLGLGSDSESHSDDQTNAILNARLSDADLLQTSPVAAAVAKAAGLSDLPVLPHAPSQSKAAASSVGVAVGVEAAADAQSKHSHSLSHASSHGQLRSELPVAITVVQPAEQTQAATTIPTTVASPNKEKRTLPGGPSAETIVLSDGVPVSVV